MANEVRLIDANEFRNRLSHVVYDIFEVHEKDGQLTGTASVGYYTDTIEEVLKQTKTVDAVEVVHGRWEWYTDRCEDLFLGCDENYGWRCSSCKVPLDEEDDPEVMPTFHYCPNCGAKMDGDGNG